MIYNAETNEPANPQVGYLSGYAYGDRLLEDVLFKFETVQGYNDKLLSHTGFGPGQADYMKQFTPLKIALWASIMITDIINHNVLMTDLEGNDLYWST